jgi:hypothetical protein
MIIVRLLLPSLLVGFATTNFTPGAGADIVMESISLIELSLGFGPILNERNRL